MKVNFRYQRGGFRVSMETKIQFEFIQLLISELKNEYNCSVHDIKIEYQVFDERLNISGADSYIVSINGNGIGQLWYSEERKPIGVNKKEFENKFFEELYDYMNDRSTDKEFMSMLWKWIEQKF